MSRSSIRAIVVGGTPAAYINARVLAAHVDRVVVVEPAPPSSTTPPAHTAPRTPHGAPVWTLGRADRATLDRWFPTLTDELAGIPALPEGAVLGVDPMRLAKALRRRLLYQRPGVTLESRRRIEALQMDHRGHAIGIVADGDSHLADLVVDCMGPHTPLLGDLPRVGFDVPELAVRFDHGIPVRRRHAEHQRRVPVGYVAAGDTLCTLDAWEADAVRIAVLQACGLAGAVGRHGVRTSRMPRAFYRRAADTLDAPWATRTRAAAHASRELAEVR